ncbi:DDE superfamily endonuclease CENP-B-like protein [Macrophomina phaseolina MS6]|uniref:DDE superfamily endonuclease CENP-B-like protein n=1 Tax=Macrophomina phaseolina (strain MS6) TaxID=1126212 RepID=K2R3Z7_MACPH|nr:DDE superfamily endonuclease CENP-B-like protein [Macrophomina phaseolina MS6]
MTLKRRRDGTHSRRDCTPNSRKLTDPEESVIVQRILDLDSRGFPPRLSAVEDTANKLLADRAGRIVGKNWPSNFVKRIPGLKTRLNHKYDYQRAKCEDPELIAQWFELVRNTIAKYGIVDGDMYNFDEAGFLMGMIAAGMVVTASEQCTRSKTVQSGNREWVTVTMAHSAVLLQAEAANLQRAN